MRFIPLAASLFFVSYLPVHAASLLCKKSSEESAAADTLVRELRSKIWHAKISKYAPRLSFVYACDGTAFVNLYEITEPSDFAKVDSLAKEALSQSRVLSTVVLRFYEREVWIEREGGAGHRGKEKHLATAVIRASHVRARVGAATNPSIERTATGKPVSAAHVERWAPRR